MHPKVLVRSESPAVAIWLDIGAVLSATMPDLKARGFQGEIQRAVNLGITESRFRGFTPQQYWHCVTGKLWDARAKLLADATVKEAEAGKVN